VYLYLDEATFISVNYPTDSDGKLCGYDLPEYQYVYFSAAPLIVDMSTCRQPERV
jgi:hypothetical protein